MVSRAGRTLVHCCSAALARAAMGGRRESWHAHPRSRSTGLRRLRPGRASHRRSPVAPSLVGDHCETRRPRRQRHRIQRVRASAGHEIQWDHVGMGLRYDTDTSTLSATLRLDHLLYGWASTGPSCAAVPSRAGYTSAGRARRTPFRLSLRLSAALLVLVAREVAGGRR